MPSEFILNRYSYERYLERQKQYQARVLIKRMEQQKLFEVREKGNRVIIKLTNKGKVTALKERIIRTDKKLPSDTFCLVSFDIPEYVKQSREVLRGFLKKVGFSQVHLSVWRSKMDVIDGLSLLVKEMRVEKWVKVYRATEG